MEFLPHFKSKCLRNPSSEYEISCHLIFKILHQKDSAGSFPFKTIAVHCCKVQSCISGDGRSPSENKEVPSKFAEDLSVSVMGDQQVISIKQKVTHYPHWLTNDNIYLLSLKEPTALMPLCLTSALAVLQPARVPMGSKRRKGRNIFPHLAPCFPISISS